MVPAKNAVRQPTHAHHFQGDGSVGEDDARPGHQVNACRHHGGGVDQGADRRGAFHGVGEPHVKGKLRGFSGRAQEEEQPDGRQHALKFTVRARSSTHSKDCLKIQRMKSPEEQGHTHREARVPNARDNKGLLAGIGGGFLRKVKTNEQVGAEPYALPAHKHQRVAGGRDQREHHEEEKVQVREEAVVTAFMLHVPARVKVNQEGDHGDRKGHDQGQAVVVERVFRAQLTGLNPGEVTDG